MVGFCELPRSGGKFLRSWKKLRTIPLFWLLTRLVLALYLIASALAAFDAKALSPVEIGLRLVAAAAIMMRAELIQFVAIAFALALLAWHHFGARRAVLT